MKRALVVLLAVAACACQDKPVCSGIVTPDLGMDTPDDCSGAWVHGEQLCPQRVSLCPGEPSICMAFSDWTEGSCECPAADASATLVIAYPLDGASVTAADDVDPSRSGIQISVSVDTSCLVPFVGYWSLEVAAEGFGPLVPEGTPVPDASGVTTAIVDMGTGGVCRRVTATGHFDSIPGGYANAYVMPDSIEVCVGG